MLYGSFFPGNVEVEKDSFCINSKIFILTPLLVPPGLKYEIIRGWVSVDGSDRAGACVKFSIYGELPVGLEWKLYEKEQAYYKI